VPQQAAAKRTSVTCAGCAAERPVSRQADVVLRGARRSPASRHGFAVTDATALAAPTPDMASDERPATCKIGQNAVLNVVPEILNCGG
jgi:hypothetical protein